MKKVFWGSKKMPTPEQVDEINKLYPDHVLSFALQDIIDELLDTTMGRSKMLKRLDKIEKIVGHAPMFQLEISHPLIFMIGIVFNEMGSKGIPTPVIFYSKEKLVDTVLVHQKFVAV